MLLSSADFHSLLSAVAWQTYVGNKRHTLSLFALKLICIARCYCSWWSCVYFSWFKRIFLGPHYKTFSFLHGSTSHANLMQSSTVSSLQAGWAGMWEFLVSMLWSRFFYCTFFSALKKKPRFIMKFSTTLTTSIQEWKIVRTLGYPVDHLEWAHTLACNALSRATLGRGLKNTIQGRIERCIVNISALSGQQESYFSLWNSCHAGTLHIRHEQTLSLPCGGLFIYYIYKYTGCPCCQVCRDCRDDDSLPPWYSPLVVKLSHSPTRIHRPPCGPCWLPTLKHPAHLH